MFQIIQDLIGNAVVSSGVSYEALCAILISSLFVIMIIGLVVPVRSWPSCWAAPASSSALSPGADPG